LQAKKEGWALKLEERHRQRRLAFEEVKAQKQEQARQKAMALDHATHTANRELEQSFKAGAKALQQQRRLLCREERLAKLRAGWMVELARRKKREDEKEEEKRKRREAWEEKQREKERRRLDYERKKREWLSKQAERYVALLLGKPRRKKPKMLCRYNGSVRQQMEWDAKVRQWETQKRAELHKKFFIGNLKWKDLTLEGSSITSFLILDIPPELWAALGSQTAIDFARQKRWEYLGQLLASFGPIVRFKEHLERNYAFVVYTEREGVVLFPTIKRLAPSSKHIFVSCVNTGAEKAMAVLSSWDERVRLVSGIKKKLLEEGQSTDYAPTPDFYLRWPKKEPHPVQMMHTPPSSAF